MHILFFVFVTLPLILLAWHLFVAMPINLLMEGSPVGALLWVSIFWGVPLLLFVGFAHR